MFLRVVPRCVGILQQAVAVHAVERIDRDADARAHHDFVAAQVERLGQRFEDAARDLGRVLRLCMFVSSTVNSSPPWRAMQHIFRVGIVARLTKSLWRSDWLSRARSFLQQEITDFVAERVVDALEAVEVEREHHQQLLGALRTRTMASLSCSLNKCRFGSPVKLS